MKPEKKPLRCAIYTRKSTDHNLELEFNSLDAQREACEAYIKSQVQEGWNLIKARYDDGAFSGATLDRPALQELLEAVRAKKVDVIVVYKVDRLTRSLADFAKLVELFDEHSVSFVSITQSFNTTTSMGRLTLNVLLSFAQFEREVIGERVRDKIAASKRKGIWVGGPVPAGYRSIDKKLVIDEPEAGKIRMIFEHYSALGSLGALQQELNAKNVRTKIQMLSNGKKRGGCLMGRGTLAQLLRNRFYIGDVSYKGEINKGDHPPIIERKLFDSVQEQLTASAVNRKIRAAHSESFLAGLLFDDRGNAMSPSHTRKRGVRYRYYISQALLQARKADAGTVSRVAAGDIEKIVCRALEARGLKPTDSLMVKNDLASVISRIELKSKSIEIHLVDHGNNELIPGTATTIVLPWTPPSKLCPKGVASGEAHSVATSNHQAILKAVAKAKVWVSELENGDAQSVAEIAKREKRVERHIRLLLPLAYLSPRTIKAFLTGSISARETVTSLAKALPFEWSRQSAFDV